MSECKILVCESTAPGDLDTYSLESNVRFNGTPVTVIVECPAGFDCSPGIYPQTITLPPGSIVIPPGVNAVTICGVVITLTGTDADFSAIAVAQAQCAATGNTPRAPFIFKRGIPIFTTSPLSGCVGSSFDIIFRVDPSMAMVSYDGWDIDVIPDGLSIQEVDEGAALRLFGVIGSSGSFKFNVTVKGTYHDGANNIYSTGSKQFTVKSAEVSGTALDDGTVDSPYTHTMQVNGPTDGNEEWSVSSGALPDGLAMDSQGNITGTPTLAGTYTFSVCFHNNL